MGRLHGCLRDGGYLFLGHSETLWQVSEDFRLVPLGSGDGAAFVYRRLDDGAGERRARAARPPHPERAAARRRTPDRRTARAAPPARRRPSRRAAPAAVPVRPVRAALAEGRYDDAARLAAAGRRRRAAATPRCTTCCGLALVDLGRDGEALPALRKRGLPRPRRGPRALPAGRRAGPPRRRGRRRPGVPRRGADPGPRPGRGATRPSSAGAACASWPRCAPSSRAS